MAAEAVAAAGADLMGFVFAPSRRQIGPAAAAALAAVVPRLGKVGVFVNTPLADVKEIIKLCHLTYVQLHGGESPAYCAQLRRACKVKIIKALQVTGKGDIAAAAAVYQAEDIDWLLFDTLTAGAYGGTGQIFDWNGLRQQADALPVPYLLAGGLNSTNVAEAVRFLAPGGVDVSGGVETAGEKDPEKIAAFVHAARQAAEGVDSKNA